MHSIAVAVRGASGITAFLPPSPAWDDALMVSDARIGRTVVIGETGRLCAWNGTTWQPLASGRRPQAGAAAVYDPAVSCSSWSWRWRLASWPCGR